MYPEQKRSLASLGFVIKLFLCLPFLSMAQIPKMPAIIPPAPNAATLGKFGDVPVSHYTGTASISIPLYTVR